MQTISNQAAAMLASSIRAPKVYVWAQLPVIVNSYGNIDAAKLGSQIILDKITKFQCVNVLDVGADKMDFQLDENTKDYSPLNNQSKFGRYFAVGAVDIKYQAFLGLTQNGAITYWPKGVYVSETVSQTSQDGASTLSVNTLDQFSLFTGNAYASFPPRLYGAQNSNYYNPNYALKNPSGDLKTYVSDTLYWMQSNTQLPIWNSDYVDVAVYSSAYQSGGTAVPNSGSTAYTIDYNKGHVTFSTAQGANDVISVDARPLAMLPELALYHLFVDYGSWDPAFLKFDATGTAIPLVELARDRSMIEIAKDIVALIAPKGARWQLWIDENGYIRLSEQAKDGPAVETLVDTKDILKASPEYSTKSLKNVVRAKSQISSNQPVEVISYDIYSISTFGQKPTMDVPQQLINMTKTMDAGTAMSYLNGICNSLLFEYCRPSLITEIDVLPNPARQIGDPINIIETKTGIGTVATSINLAPNPDNFTGWTTNANMSISSGGPNGSKDFEYTGTGVAMTANAAATSPTFSVIPGTTYKPSWWVDFSQVTQGYPDMQVFDVLGWSIVDDSFGITPGAVGRFPGPSFTIPKNLVKNSDLLNSGSGWLQEGNGWSVTANGPSATNSWKISGTGAAMNIDVDAPAIPVNIGDSLYCRGWISYAASVVTSGSVCWALYTCDATGRPSSLIQRVNATQASGAAYVTATITVPSSGYTGYVTWIAWTGNATIASGQPVYYSAPSVYKNPGAISAYFSDTSPKIFMQPFLWSGQSGGFIANSGGKVKFAQPQVEIGNTASAYSPGISTSNYLPSRFRINQIENKIDGEDWVQTLQVERQALSQDWNFGISANLGTDSNTNANAIVTQSGYLVDVSLNNSGGDVVHVVSNGQPLMDSSFMPVIFNWNGGPLSVGITIGNIQSGATAYIWRWLYIAEDAYYNGNVIMGSGSNLTAGDVISASTTDLWGLSGVPTLPYDVRANADTPISRKYWWPLLRCSDWLTNDGVTGYTTQTTLNSTWSGGPGVSSGNWYAYGNLRVGKNDFFGDTTTGFVGQEIFASGTPAADAIGTGSTIKYGVDFGRTFSSTPVYSGIKNKFTPAYLCILVASTSGTMQFKRIALMLNS